MTAKDARKTLFIDFDGTLAERGSVPEAHRTAIVAARGNGHRVLLCTGRPLSIIDEDELGVEIDGIVAAAGAYIRLDGEVLRDEPFPADLAQRTVEVLQRHGAEYALEATDAFYATAGLADRLGVYAQPAILRALRQPEDMFEPRFAKVAVWSSPVPIEQLAAEIGEEIRPLPNSLAVEEGRLAGEMQRHAIDKADGVRIVAEHVGFDLADVIGFGDGMNDLHMLQEAGTAVAIEGAQPELLAAADLVVPGPAQHGLVEAFEKLGLTTS
ncbi:MAG: Cof-type HAD-IIB family hydrolase [Brachybacterium sp.]|nr:Cof-type HAD-IIB family hydrolase [Brachybacterium sp.]